MKIAYVHSVRIGIMEISRIAWFVLLLVMFSCERKAIPQLHDHIDDALQSDSVLAAFELVDSILLSREMFEIVDGWYVNSDGSYGFKTYRPNSPPGYSMQALREAMFERMDPQMVGRWSSTLDRLVDAIFILYKSEIRFGWNRTAEDCAVVLFNYGHIDEAMYYDDARYLTLNRTTEITLGHCSIRSLLMMERTDELTLWHHDLHWYPGYKSSSR
jgi:hypothetical protein